MPMRAIPFDVVCLLGMNDGDFAPRHARGLRPDGLARVAASRRPRAATMTASRCWMLCCRPQQALYQLGRSPCARQQRQPPSVLVSQLRDYLAQGWQGDGGGDLLAQRTRQHRCSPLAAVTLNRPRDWPTCPRMVARMKSGQRRCCRSWLPSSPTRGVADIGATEISAPSVRSFCATACRCASNRTRSCWRTTSGSAPMA